MKRTAMIMLGLALVAGCGSQSPSSAPPTAGSTAQGPASLPTHLHVAVSAWKLPYAIAREAVVPIGNGKVLVAGGMFPDDTSSARAFDLTLATGQVSMLAPLSVDVHDVAGGLYNGEPATYGGGNGSEQSVVQQFHNGSWRVIDHMPTTRSDLSVAEVKGSTYVLGGYDGSGVPTEVLTQSGNAGLQPIGKLAHGFRYAASAAFGTSIFLFGGEVNGAELSVVQRYDTVTQSTLVVGHLPEALGHASAVVLGNRILVIGGRVQPNVGTTAMWWFDPTTATFTKAGDLPIPVTDAAVAVSADGLTAWLLGGENGTTVLDEVIKLSLS